MTDNDHAELLALDAVVAADYWTTVLDRVRDAATDVHRVVDLGSGTGTGARGLADRFPAAEVVDVDSDEQLLSALAASDERVRPVLADLDAGWPRELTDVDVTFASMSLHHVGDAARTLRDVYDATRPGGIVATAEFRDPLRVLRDDHGDGLEARWLDAIRHGHETPDLAADWPARLADAGFEVVTTEDLVIDRPAPLDAAGTRYATLWLSRLRNAAGDHPSATDRALLDRVIEGEDADALHLHGTRHLTIGRRSPAP